MYKNKDGSTIFLRFVVLWIIFLSKCNFEQFSLISNSVRFSRESMHGTILECEITTIGTDIIGDNIGRQIAQIYERRTRIPVEIIVLEAWFSPRCGGDGGVTMLRRVARGRTIPWYPAMHVRTPGAAVTGRHGFQTWQGWLCRNAYPGTPEEELRKTTAKSAKIFKEHKVKSDFSENSNARITEIFHIIDTRL